MHVLIIPSEEFVPKGHHTKGIFQYHQARILNENGYKVGVISITQQYSIPMLIKSFVYKVIRKQTGNITDEQSFSQVLILLFNKLFSINKYIKEEVLDGITVFRAEGFYYLSPSDNRNSYGWVKAGVAAFRQYINKYGKPDIIHAHNAMYAGMLARRLSKLYGIKYVVTEHSTMFARGLISSKQLKRKIETAYKDSRKCFAVSNPFCLLLEKQFQGISFNYLPNVIDPYIEQITLSSVQDANRFVFLNIAELHPKKNHKLLIDAFYGMKRTGLYPDAKLWIGGTGSEQDLIQQQIAACAMQGEIILLGLLDRRNVVESIHSAHCIVSSSDIETFGVVLIESMFFGKPVITTSCGGPESFVNNTVGIVVEKGNVEELQNAMIDMYKQYKKYNQDEIRRYAVEEFGGQQFYKRLSTEYEAALS